MAKVVNKQSFPIGYKTPNGGATLPPNGVRDIDFDFFSLNNDLVGLVVVTGDIVKEQPVKIKQESKPDSEIKPVVKTEPKDVEKIPFVEKVDEKPEEVKIDSVESSDKKQILIKKLMRKTVSELNDLAARKDISGINIRMKKPVIVNKIAAAILNEKQ